MLSTLSNLSVLIFVLLVYGVYLLLIPFMIVLRPLLFDKKERKADETYWINAKR